MCDAGDDLRLSDEVRPNDGFVDYRTTDGTLNHSSSDDWLLHYALLQHLRAAKSQSTEMRSADDVGGDEWDECWC